MENEIFVWNAELVINLHWVLLFYEASNYVHFALQQWLCKHHIHWLCVIKCDDNLIDRKSFWSLDFNWETFMQPTWAKYLGQRRKELFPFTLNNSCPLDWNLLILVSEIKNTNMSSGEMISSQQFSRCLICMQMNS